MPAIETLTSKLKQAGMRLTPQRIAICKLLSESKAHPSAQMIYDDIRADFPSLSLMTVYNTLNVLVDLSAINEIGHAGDGNLHYDGDTEPHVNLACISCHTIIDLPSQHVDQLNQEVGRLSGYELVGARVLYYGLCPECQQEARRKEFLN